MKSLFFRCKAFLERIDKVRDRALRVFIERYWPRAVTPNSLTVARIIIGLALFVFLFYGRHNSRAVIFLLFAVGAVTDFLDGSVARILKKESQLGALLDSTADRILIIPIAVYILFQLHRWLFLSLIFLEILNALVSVWAQGKSIFIPSNIFGKTKMFIQSLVFAALLLFAPSIIFTYLLWVSVALLIASILLKWQQLKLSSTPYHA